MGAPGVGGEKFFESERERKGLKKNEIKRGRGKKNIDIASQVCTVHAQHEIPSQEETKKKPLQLRSYRQSTYPTYLPYLERV